MIQRSIRGYAVIAIIVSSALLAACAQDDESANIPAATTTATQQATTTANKVTSPYSGIVDGNDCRVVRGWVWNSADPKAEVKVELYIDDKLIATTPAKTLRPDLKSKGLGTGAYGFSFNIPPANKDGKEHMVKVKVANSDYNLPLNEGVFPTFTCGA